jgi:hypothetical protein
MHFTSLVRNAAVIIGISIFSLTACKKKDTTTTTTTTPALTSADDNGGYASDAAKLESGSNDAISIADNAANYGSANLRITSGYPVVTNDTAVTPHVLTIDFGPTNHVCIDGKNRKGKIIVTYTGHYKDSASSHTITYSGYYVNDLQHTGSKTVTNMGRNLAGNVWYNVTVNDSIILASDSVISWSGSRTRTWLTGYGTSTRSDDAYTIGGTTTLKRANGRSFTFTISSTSPLKVEVGCPYIESGIVTVSSTSFTGGDRTLDYGYGTGGCDDKAQLTVGAHTYVITLH